MVFAGSFGSVKAQSLKDLLYSGKLKNDAGVVRKTDDLSTKIDTSTRRPQAETVVKAEAEKPASSSQPTVRTVNPAQPAAKSDTSATTSADQVEVRTEVATTQEVEPTPPPPPAPKSNSKLWKERVDALVKELQADVLPNKKVKKETYFLTVDYELAEDGQVSILNVTSAPENEFLAGQVKERLIQNAPTLAPQTDSTGKARKVKRKQNFTVTKE